MDGVRDHQVEIDALLDDERVPLELKALLRISDAMLVESEPGLTVVGEATDGLEAVDQALALRPDVVVMDIRMPRAGGVDRPGHALLARAGFARHEDATVGLGGPLDLEFEPVGRQRRAPDADRRS